MKKDQKKAYLFALSAIACWSTVGSAFKLSLRELAPVPLLIYASFSACVVLLIILMVQGKLSLLRRMTGLQLMKSALLGLLNPFLYYVVLLKAYDLLPAQEAGTLNYIWPLVLVLLSIPLLKQRIGAMSLLAILISFTGILVISTHGRVLDFQLSNPAGVALAVGSAVFWSLYWIWSVNDPRDAVAKLFVNFCFGFLFALVYGVSTGQVVVPSYAGMAGALYIGLFEMGLTFVLWLLALKYSSTTARVSNLIYLSPFLSLIIIHFAVGEKILLSTVAGLILIILGIILQHRLKERV
jgi:drug/metabolite transporter (DMT)-like permease